MSLYRKYRPQKFEDLVGEDHVRDTLTTAIKENRLSHGYLFAGPRGTGKTTVARLVAKAANCQRREELNKKNSGEPCGECEFCLGASGGKNLDIIEIDAASNRGIDEIRDLREKVKFAPTSGKYKVYIIDEVHMLTLPAFNALLKTLEEPPAHAIFILATTEAHKVPATILSRVQRFDFRRIGKDDIIKNLKIIAAAEKIKADDESLEAIAVAAEGSHRDAISIFEQVSSLSADVTISGVRNVLGLAKSEEILALIDFLAAGDSKSALAKVGELISTGVDAGQLIKETTEVVRKLLLVKISGADINFEVTGEQMTKLNRLAEKFSAGQLNKMLGIFIAAGNLSKETAIHSLPMEMAMIEINQLKVKSEKLKVKEEENPKSHSGLSPLAHPSESKTEYQNPKQIESNPKFEEKIEEKPKPEAVIPIVEEIVAEKSPTGGEELQNIDEKLWREIVEKVKSHNHTLNALLRDAKPEGIEGEKLLLSVRFKFHHDKISELKNRAIIEEVVAAVVGRKLNIVCQVAEKKSQATKSQPVEKVVGEEDLEKVAEEIFEVE